MHCGECHVLSDSQSYDFETITHLLHNNPCCVVKVMFEARFPHRGEQCLNSFIVRTPAQGSGHRCREEGLPTRSESCLRLAAGVTTS